MLSVAIIGISGYGAILTDLLRKFTARDEIRFIAAAVINRDEEQERCKILEQEGVQIFNDHREMLSAPASKIDLCIVPVGIPWHASIAIDVLEAGVNVFLEKPIAGSYIDAARICEVAQLQQRHLIVGFQDLSDPGVWAIKDALLSGVIGDILEIRAAGAWPRPMEYFQRNAWAGKLNVNGILVRDSPHNNALAHLVNLALFWAGKDRDSSATPRTAEGHLYRFLPIESFDTGWIQWNVDNGPRVVCAFSHSSERIISPQILVQGTSGTLLWDYKHGLVENGFQLSPPPRPDLLELRELGFQSAFTLLKGKPALRCRTDNALAHAKAIDLAHGCLPIQTGSASEVQVEYRADGEYRFVRGLEKWCASALRPTIRPETGESFLKENADFQSALK